MTARTDPHRTRDYSLPGTDTICAKATGLAGAEWYRTEVPRKVMKDLMQRRDGLVLGDTINCPDMSSGSRFRSVLRCLRRSA